MELIGKWVLLDGIHHGSIVQKRPWLVTDVKKTRVYLEMTHKDGSKEGKYVQKKSVIAAFECEESAKKAGQNCWDLSWHWWSVAQKKCKSEQAENIAALGGVFCGKGE